MLTLEDLKTYLRVDGEDEDDLILSLFDTAKRLVMDTGRINETELEENKDVTYTAIKYTVSYLYENRNTADHHHLNEMLRHQFFALREGVL
jgi:uncharacterized phage protein (predicted DNA packaging)